MAKVNGTPIIGAPKPDFSPGKILESAQKTVDQMEHVVVIAINKDGTLGQFCSDMPTKDLHFLGGVLQETALGPYRAHQQAMAMQRIQGNQAVRKMMNQMSGNDG